MTKYQNGCNQRGKKVYCKNCIFEPFDAGCNMRTFLHGTHPQVFESEA